MKNKLGLFYNSGLLFGLLNWLTAISVWKLAGFQFTNIFWILLVYLIGALVSGTVLHYLRSSEDRPKEKKTGFQGGLSEQITARHDARSWVWKETTTLQSKNTPVPVTDTEGSLTDTEGSLTKAEAKKQKQILRIRDRFVKETGMWFGCHTMYLDWLERQIPAPKIKKRGKNSGEKK